MSRTHKDRHRWKRKERRRTGQSDPDKIKLHRERFLKRLERHIMIQTGYEPIVFQAGLRFIVEEELTELSIRGEKIAEMPFLVDDPTSCHYAAAAHKQDFNASYEADALSKQVQRVRFLEQPCNLMMQIGERKVCSSIVDCPYRRWVAEEGQPRCALS